MVSFIKHVFPIVVLACGVYAYFFIFSSIPGPTVETKSGKIQGTKASSRDGREYFQYLGIPYAQKPVGELRFEDPKPVEKWDGVLYANKFGAECLQLEVLILSKVIGAEDCLFLNVFTNNVGPQRPKKLQPVLVYIHGGLFHGGSSNMYKGKYFLDHDVVLVSLNYRVAALGFLASGDGVVRGNMGLKDQSLALKWISENIAAFGGDPKKITLIGESAGGASVHYHMLSPLSAGLFQKAISMSGTAVRDYRSTKNQAGQLRYFAAKFGCTQETSKEIVQCLKKVEGHVLVEGHREQSEPFQNNEFGLYVPIVEVINDSKAFIAEDPKSLIKKGKVAKIPWACGVVSMEGLLYVARITRSPEAIKRLNEDWEKDALARLLRQDNLDPKITRKIKEFYLGKGPVDTMKSIDELSNILSDKFFIHPSYHAVKLQSKLSPVYFYYLTYKPQTSVYHLITSITPNSAISPVLEFSVSLVTRWIQKNIFGMEITTYGPSHGDELSLLFDMNPIIEISKRSQDYEFSRTLVSLFYNFAKDETAVSLNDNPWISVNPSDDIPKFLELNVNGSFHTRPETEEIGRRLKFWDKLKLNEA